MFRLCLHSTQLMLQLQAAGIEMNPQVRDTMRTIREVALQPNGA